MDGERSYWDRIIRRRLSRRKLLEAGALTGIGAVAGAALGCNTGQPSPQANTAKTDQPKYGGTLKIGYTTGFGYLAPGNSRDSTNANWYGIYADYMVYSLPDGNPDPENSLCASWKRDDDLTFTFKLRDGIKFHDGTDYDAEAQKWYFEYIMDANRTKSFAYRGQLDAIKQIEVVDKLTLRVRLSRVNPALLSTLGGQCGVPDSPTAIQKLGPDIITHPYPTGPFMVKSYVNGGTTEFVKNPNYWQKGKPYLDGITITEIPDPQVRAASLLSGNVDMAFFDSPGDATEKLKQDPNINIVSCLDGPWVISLNQTLPPLDDVRIRQAIASCIDRETICKVVYQNILTPAKGGMMNPGSWAYKDVSDVAPKFDINKAKQLIKDSGIKTPIRLTFLTRDAPKDLIDQAQLIKGWLDDAGFATDMQVFPLTELQRRFNDDLSVHMVLSGAGCRADPDGQFSIYTTSTSYYNAGRKATDAQQKWYDDMVAKGVGTYDMNERKKIYDEIQVKMAQDVFAHIPVAYRLYQVAHRKNVHGTENIWKPSWGTYDARFVWMG